MGSRTHTAADQGIATAPLRCHEAGVDSFTLFVWLMIG